jgi:hypothetical protein
MMGEIVWSSDGSSFEVAGTTPHDVMTAAAAKNVHCKFLKVILASLPELRKNFFLGTQENYHETLRFKSLWQRIWALIRKDDGITRSSMIRSLLFLALGLNCPHWLVLMQAQLPENNAELPVIGFSAVCRIRFIYKHP